MRVMSLVTAVAMSWAAPAMSEDIKVFQAGFWKGGAQVDSAGNLFDCYLRAQSMRDGYSIFLRWDKAGFHLTLFDPSWSLETADPSRGRVRIDNRYDEDVSLVLLAPNVVDYQFFDDG